MFRGSQNCLLTVFFQIKHNIRYISGGSDAQLERFTIPIKFVTAERNVISNAARNIPSPL